MRVGDLPTVAVMVCSLLQMRAPATAPGQDTRPAWGRNFPGSRHRRKCRQWGVPMAGRLVYFGGRHGPRVERSTEVDTVAPARFPSSPRATRGRAMARVAGTVAGPARGRPPGHGLAVPRARVWWKHDFHHRPGPDSVDELRESPTFRAGARPGHARDLRHLAGCARLRSKHRADCCAFPPFDGGGAGQVRYCAPAYLARQHRAAGTGSRTTENLVCAGFAAAPEQRGPSLRHDIIFTVPSGSPQQIRVRLATTKPLKSTTPA